MTFTDLLNHQIELGHKYNMAQSWGNYLSFRAAWLSLLAADGWTENEWFLAATPWGAAQSA